MKTAEFLKFELPVKESEQFPLNFPGIFDRAAPIGVEIGCGNGEYLAGWAAENPDWNFIGFEISLESAERIQQRLYRQGIKNARIIREDGRFGLREFFPDNFVDQVKVNFPDPWPKKRHRHHRLITPDFIRTLRAVLKTGGEFELLTDQKWYANDAYAMFGQFSEFRTGIVQKNPPRSLKTKYERKWWERGSDSYRLAAVKLNHESVQRRLENGEMPHCILNKKVNIDEAMALQGFTQKSGEMVFAVKNIFLDNRQTTFLLRVVTSDNNFSQKFYLLISPHPKGTIVKLDPNTQPYRTPSVKWLVENIGQHLGAET